MGSTSNIIFGEVAVKIGDYGSETLTDVGFTQGGVDVNPADDYKEVKCDQQKGTILEKLISRKLTIGFSMLEVTLANLAYYFNLPDSAVTGNTLTGNLETKDFHQVVLVGENESGYARTVTFPKCKVRSNGAWSQNPEEEQLLPVEVTALPDASANNQTFQVVDATS